MGHWPIRGRQSTDKEKWSLFWRIPVKVICRWFVVTGHRTTEQRGGRLEVIFIDDTAFVTNIQHSEGFTQTHYLTYYTERKLDQRCQHLQMTDNSWRCEDAVTSPFPLAAPRDPSQYVATAWWPLSCEPLSCSANQRPALVCSDQSEASVNCNRGEINDPLTCGHRSHSDKLLTANSWSASAQIARRMRLTPNIICCHFSPGLSLVSQSSWGLSLVS